MVPANELYTTSLLVVKISYLLGDVPVLHVIGAGDDTSDTAV